MSVQSEVRAWLIPAAGVVLLGSIAYRVLTFPAIPDLAPTVTKLNATVDRANKTLDLINAPCAPGPCGPIENASRTVTKMSDLAVDVQLQVKQSGTLVNAASQSLQGVSMQAQTDLTTLNEQEKLLGPLLGQATVAVGNASDTIVVLKRTIGDADAVITDKDLVDLIQHTDNVADHLDGLTGDIEAKTRSLIYPAPCRGGYCWMRRTYTIVKGVVTLGEPAYYWGALSTQILH